MPWQAHLFIGERVHDYEEVRAIFTKLDPKIVFPDDHDDYMCELEVPFDLVLHGLPYIRTCMLEIVSEGGYPFPADKTYANTGALVGIKLTSRYSPSILDRAHPHGRPDPFEVNIGEVVELLNQVRIRWPEANLLLCDIFH